MYRRWPDNCTQTIKTIDYDTHGILSDSFGYHVFAGIYGFFTRRNTLAILISIELILNATDINFAVFNRFLFPDGMEGYFFALFSIAISAAETAVAIAIMINIYRNIRSIQVGKLDEMKW